MAKSNKTRTFFSNEKARALAAVGVFTALAYICCVLFHFKVSFLSFDLKDAVMAIGAIRGLTDLGLRVPEDVSVIGYDGIEIGTYYIPKLTTVGQQADLLAKRGLALLLAGIEKHSPASHEKVPFELLINSSVARKD